MTKLQRARNQSRMDKDVMKEWKRNYQRKYKGKCFGWNRMKRNRELLKSYFRMIRCDGE